MAGELRDEQGRSHRGMARAGGSCGAGRGGRVEGAGPRRRVRRSYLHNWRQARSGRARRLIRPRRKPSRGARIALLSPAGAVKVLTAEFQSAADPNVSWDAKKILFAGRKTAANPWQIYEDERRRKWRAADGRRAVGLPAADLPVEDFYPGRPAAAADQLHGHRAGTGRAKTESAVVWSLYSARPGRPAGCGGSTYNPSGDNDPVMNEDGRIVYSSWQRHTLAWGAAGRAALFGVNLDGSDVAIFAGDEGRPTPIQAGAVRDAIGARVVFVESDGLTPDGAGNPSERGSAAQSAFLQGTDEAARGCM